MLKGLLTVLSVFDWISPLAAVASEVANNGGGQSSTFFVDVSAARWNGWTMKNIAGLLNQHGIDTYGDLFRPYANDWQFLVRSEDAERARYILAVKHVPYTGGN